MILKSYNITIILSQIYTLTFVPHLWKLDHRLNYTYIDWIEILSLILSLFSNAVFRKNLYFVQVWGLHFLSLISPFNAKRFNAFVCVGVFWTFPRSKISYFSGSILLSTYLIYVFVSSCCKLTLSFHKNDIFMIKKYLLEYHNSIQFCFRTHFKLLPHKMHIV